jgi:hypothetical protein
VTFELNRLRLHFRAVQPLVFPAGSPANVLRGALGKVLHQTAPPEYARIFAPQSAGGPSGLADAPRPFVFRAAHLDGVTIAPGAAFHFDVHLFDREPSVARRVGDAFTQFGRAELESVEQQALAIELDGPIEPAARVRLRFVTPTELKADQKLVTRPEFAVLFARLRDRISTLRALYGGGPLDIDFRRMGERAARVQLLRCELSWIETERRSGRTGQTHPLGGFTGEAEYEGDLGEFLPYLRAGQWTGVGRQTVWGKGEICCDVCS